jgi:hypothetical protein
MRSDDRTLSSLLIVFWTMMEISIAIIIACIPTLKPLVDRVCPRLLAVPTGMEMMDTDGDTRPPTISSGPSRQLWYELEQP